MADGSETLDQAGLSELGKTFSGAGLRSVAWCRPPEVCNLRDGKHAHSKRENFEDVYVASGQGEGQSVALLMKETVPHWFVVVSAFLRR